MNDDIVTRIRDGIRACFCHDSLDDYECDICPLHAEAADEIERLRERNTILFDALRALTNGKSMYFTESLGRTVTMDAQNSWMELPDEH